MVACPEDYSCSLCQTLHKESFSHLFYLNCFVFFYFYFQLQQLFKKNKVNSTQLLTIINFKSSIKNEAIRPLSKILHLNPNVSKQKLLSHFSIILSYHKKSFGNSQEYLYIYIHSLPKYFLIFVISLFYYVSAVLFLCEHHFTDTA